MGEIMQLTADAHRELERAAQACTRGAAALEQAAQRFTDLLYGQLKPAIVLTRVFATVPFGELPAVNQRWVRDLAASAERPQPVDDQMLVLSLLGTSGVEASWNDRRSSTGHVGIPLASGAFIEAIPMMSRLLKQLGLGLDWIDHRDTVIVARTLGSSSGVFHVPDAATEVDAHGRKVIPAQDFVAAHGVKTVFGIGGAFMGTTTFMVAVVFCRETVDRSKAQAFMPLINRLKVSTVDLVRQGRIFAADGPAG
jgi:hypothetical protein